MPNIRFPAIRPLDTPADGTHAAAWVYEQWAQYESATVWETTQADILRSLDPSVAVPKFFGCHEQGQLIGIASLVRRDLPVRPTLGPWLSNVLVRTDCRGRGLGSALVRHVMDYAAALVPQIYLYTFDQVDLYQRLGWQIVDTDTYVQRPITIMRYAFDARDASTPAAQ